MAEQTSKYCSRIILVHVHATGFSKVHPACHTSATGIKPGSDSKRTDKHAADCSKAVCSGVRSINCSYNNVAKGIRLLDKKAFKLFIQENFHVRAFERYIPLMSIRFTFITCLHVEQHIVLVSAQIEALFT